jgi:hypothetical protein
VEEVVALRLQRYSGWRIADNVGLSRPTISRILRRVRLSRWRDLHPQPPIERYDHVALPWCSLWYKLQDGPLRRVDIASEKQLSHSAGIGVCWMAGMSLPHEEKPRWKAYGMRTSSQDRCKATG